MQLSLEIEKSILADLLKKNSHPWILCCFHAQVIHKFSVYTTFPALSLSSLLTPKALGDPIPLNTQPKDPKIQTKPTSLSKQASRVVTRSERGSLYHFHIKNCKFSNFLDYFIVTLYFYGKVVVFVVTCFFLLLITKRP